MAQHAREFLIIVGGPSNTFNGYGHYDTSDNYHAEPKPTDTSPTAINRYIHGDPAQQNPADPSTKTSTHDLYWANFIYAAVKLIELRGRVPEAIKPARGDIVTFLLYLPPYTVDNPTGTPQDRQAIDWDASPYNQGKHASSAWVNTSPYDPRFRRGDQGRELVPPIPPTRSTTTTHTPPKYSATEADINHEILMRTTSEVDDNGKPAPDGGFPKRPHEPEDYIDEITDIPERLCYGARRGDNPPITGVGPLLGVNVKVLFVRDVEQLFGYLVTGTWAGNRRLSRWELTDEEHLSRGDIASCSWTGQALVAHAGPHPDWASDPAVDRSVVKIRRLDYVGHSTDDELFLRYGWTNAKGEQPEADVVISQTDLTGRLSQALFTNNAQIFLWGCDLGSSMAAALAPLLNRPASVRACLGTTLFTNLLDPGNANNLPEPLDPVNAGWVVR